MISQNKNNFKDCSSSWKRRRLRNWTVCMIDEAFKFYDLLHSDSMEEESLEFVSGWGEPLQPNWNIRRDEGGFMFHLLLAPMRCAASYRNCTRGGGGGMRRHRLIDGRSWLLRLFLMDEKIKDFSSGTIKRSKMCESEEASDLNQKWRKKVLLHVNYST